MTLDLYNHDSLVSIFGRDPQVYRKTALVKAVQVHQSFLVHTLDGECSGVAGDYICQAFGEKWIVKKRIFEKTYEVIN